MSSGIPGRLNATGVALQALDQGRPFGGTQHLQRGLGRGGVGGAGAVVKIKGRARLTSNSVITRAPATKPPRLPSALDRVPTRSASHGGGPA